MQVLVLGALEIVIDGASLELGAQRQQIILGTLALEANRVIRITRLMEALYGEDLPSTSRVQVQICISALRRRFTEKGFADAIGTRSQGYSLQLPAGSLDLHRFEEALTQARQFREFRRLDEAVVNYRKALALWRGPVLDGLESRVIQQAADRLAERRLTVTEECLDLELQLGRHRELIDELGSLVDEHPLRGRLREHLMLALYRSGRQAEALETYRAARKLFIEELGLEPSEELRRLEHSVLTDDPHLALPEQPGASVSLTPVSPPAPLVPPLAPMRVGEPIEPAAPESSPASPPPAFAVPAVAEIPPVSGVPISPGGLAVSPVPCLLPTDIADFTGRSLQMEAIQMQVEAATENRLEFAVPVVVMVGKPGIGKTTLAVHAAHRLAERYPDGQLFADLHGRRPEQIGPMRVLERFLRALGVPGTQMPDLLEERAELYRTLLADRRMLVVLDNAGGESQVRPLIPGTSQSAVLITSRGRFGGLPGAVHLQVEVFNAEHSVELISRIAGAERVESELDSTAELAELCGHLPLALRIAGARLAARPHWSVEQLVDRLANEARRLDELKHSGMGIRASISLTYDHLEEDARRLFRLLTVVNFPHVTAWIAAALLDADIDDAQDLLDDLADAQLIETGGTGRGANTQYRVHDLIRVFAREQLFAEEGVQERAEALRRALGALLFLAQEAHRGVLGGDYLMLYSNASLHELPAKQTRRIIGSPIAWYEQERLTLVAAVRQAARAGLVTHCWGLALISVTLFEYRIYLTDWRETNQIALGAAEQAGDERGQAALLTSSGSLLLREGRFAEALEALQSARGLFERAGNEHDLAEVSRNEGVIHRMAGRFTEAFECYTTCLAPLREVGDLAAVAFVLHNMAHIKLEQDDLPAARAFLAESLEGARQAGSRRLQAQVLHRLGDTELRAGEPKAAMDFYGQALAIVREVGDPMGQAFTLYGLGMAYLRTGSLVECSAALTEALELAGAAGERLMVARVSMLIGELAMAEGDPQRAVAHLHRSLGLFRAISSPEMEKRALGLLSDAYALSDHSNMVPAKPE
ncbi:AfsR/SARP family transcriptional regulator [Paractinoplanes lichenicola]|uniref:Tetratricopeptide repeat protein n=1 Tax=Paractinoplanes lichenicola TaxID=2802976 RepID=A0ABS1W0P8_9ACTN|nr:AfsR/SARP family transcriptional regulator [Actinoplanes lichenicola]MBL7260311.1 tetratricopeptide repeat protein [Actinoplanes lichenicola]